MNHVRVASLFPKPKTKPRRKTTIPKALREQVWLKTMKKSFDGKCPVVWCTNTINAFDFQCGHNIPESKGGKTTLENLIPLCGRCNVSMGDRYTIDEWNAKFSEPVPRPPWWSRFVCGQRSKEGRDALASGRVPALR
jgi:5-methylcytosine-specific restriction endonuclease McrA